MRLHLFIMLLLSSSVAAFVVKPETIVHHPLAMVGGPGWDNGSFLDGLSGDAGNSEDAKKDYQEFKETRAAFAKRQQERMNTEAG